MTRRREWLPIWIGLVIVLLVGVFAGAAGAQEDEGGRDSAQAPTLVRAVNSRNAENANLQLMTGRSVESLTMTQNGQELDLGEIATLNERRPLDIVVVVDTGTVMNDSGGLGAAEDAIRELTEAVGEDDQLAVVQAGDTARTLVDLTTSRGLVDDAADTLAVSAEGGSQLWTAIRTAAELLAADPAGQPNILVLTSGQNITDSDMVNAAVGQAEAAGAGTFVAGVGNRFPADTFQSFVNQTGGAVQGTTAGELDGTALDMAGWLTDDQYVVEFTPVITEDNVVAPTTLNLGDTAIEFAYVTGTLAQGASRLEPYEPTEPSGLNALPFLQGDTGQLVIVILVLLAVAGLIYALIMIFSPDDGALSNVLQPYSEGYRDDSDFEDEGGSALARTALLQRAVSITEQVAESQGYLSRTESALERADLPLRAAEALFFYVALVAVVGIVSLIFFPPMGALVITLVVALIGPALVSFKAGQRRRKFQELLPDTLQLLAGTLRAGYSLMQGVEAVSQEVSEPMGKELRRVVTEARLGRPLEEALDGVAERMASPDFAWAVMAIRIQREVGGNLSELLLTVADTMVSRERLRRDIQALTAEGRMSAMVLGALPIGLGVVMFVINPKYMARLIDDTLGNILLGLAIVGMLIGFSWMRQIIKIEV